MRLFIATLLLAISYAQTASSAFIEEQCNCDGSVLVEDSVAYPDFGSCRAKCESTANCRYFGVWDSEGYSDYCRMWDSCNDCKSASHHNFVYELNPEATGTWTCQAGETASYEPYAISADNSEASCGAACDADFKCYAFDYTTESVSDACRLTTHIDHASARLGDGGEDNRMYCSPDTWTCQTGQTASKGAYTFSADNSKASCGAACDADSACYAFDYTTKSHLSSCRFTTQIDHADARLGDGGADNRMYCSPECTSDGDCDFENGYFCSSQQECRKWHHEYCRWNVCGHGDGKCDAIDADECSASSEVGMWCASGLWDRMHPTVPKFGYRNDLEEGLYYPGQTCYDRAEYPCTSDADCDLSRGEYCLSDGYCITFIIMNYCDRYGPCQAGEGRCHYHHECAGDLVCGTNNFAALHPGISVVEDFIDFTIESGCQEIGTPTSTTDDFEIFGDGCHAVVEENWSCVETTNYPNAMTGYQWCVVTALRDNALTMVSDDVSCEVYTDYLVVAGQNLNLLATADNGDYYDDSDNRQMAENMPPSISASEKITWRVGKSYGVSSSGWKICFGSEFEPTQQPVAEPVEEIAEDCTKRDYAESVAHCASIGKKIASFHSQEEFDAVLVDGKLTCNVYIGASSDGDGHWSWEDGSEWWESSWNDGLKGTKENKIVVLKKGKWVDWGQGQALQGVICQDLSTELANSFNLQTITYEYMGFITFSFTGFVAILLATYEAVERCRKPSEFQHVEEI